ncbi:MAG: hypothetical protein A2900_04590 [Candidatus Chisholmbacteria bacterium RIFCSPLOWO2_01_FULL_50_28]|uniref:Uncharacterized protein n=1 Tax=Candidatus Chisholmbacteria bacterium RIFCSPHIGHO2_01_FULL_52_32 TaxID=1797591 RepID=A0A1G1VSC7_9BACT|nr:MAG: hypothetical protein A2786_02155 [Candidatus Chisholmbacteria bacterium RIFCSPHIGHO2_01_FULL_52_32]OGY20329.1 MAG: hypothetical protein A2900_04590 [Candidatus Chisholmbacteria bacterium RIFCSPLOWO2_01_FULL_50_28]
MLAATHAIAGAAIANLAPSPAIGVVAALLSHPLLDCVPHWDLRTRHKNRGRNRVILYSLLDAVIGFTVGFLLIPRTVSPLLLFLTMFSAQLPDWIEAPYVIFRWRFPPFSWVKTIQHILHQKLPFPDGLLVQVILVFFLLLITK